MKKFIHPSESGQALILLVLAVVGLLGFTALAIDGGMVYADRRHAQNATDAASLAGGGVAALHLENSYVTYEDFDCNDYRVLAAMEVAKDAAVSRAGSNDFGIDKEISDDNGVVTECVDDLNNGTFIDKYIDVRTRITMQTRTSFIHFVYNGPLINTVEAVTRIRPNTVLVFGNAIVSTSSLCDGNEGGVTFDGGGNPDAIIKVNGGGIFSNSCLDTNGGPKVEITNGTVGYVTDYSPPSSGYVTPEPQQAGTSMPEKSVPAPNCFDDSMQARSVPGGSSVTIQPGRYDRIRLTGGGELVMEPGLYCVTNDFTANNGILTGNGVTIYMIADDFSVSGNVTVNLTAPPSTCKATMPNVCPPAQPGMLIYMAEGNEGVISMEGNSDSHYTGTVYSPDGTIDAGGGSSTMAEINAQLIGDTVKVHGNVTIDINFIGAENYHLPAMLELFK